jgi:hypothetical protein
LVVKNFFFKEFPLYASRSKVWIKKAIHRDRARGCARERERESKQVSGGESERAKDRERESERWREDNLSSLVMLHGVWHFTEVHVGISLSLSLHFFVSTHTHTHTPSEE